MINFNTDLADERRDIFRKANNIENEIPGVETEEQQEEKNIKTFKVKILDRQGEQALGKPIGTYITIDIKNLKIAEENEIQKASEAVTKQLKELIGKYVRKEEDILVVGLGNEFVTPDSLGPKVISEVDITRHFLKYTPEYIDSNTRPVSAISPGVLGTTGIETVEIIRGVVDNIKPKLLIVIDSLSSKSIERISSTVQISDTGIVPGAGVGNKRNEISVNTIRSSSFSNRCANGFRGSYNSSR
ncbi:MAG: GPR endopeptidase [Clostridia bacterium]|nr:GPR endopeptidase [Clostridia bacterium]